MNNSLKGAVLSGLVFPGLGQVVLKHYKRGAVLILTVLLSLSVIVVKVVQQALAILEKIESEGGTIDKNTISNAAAQASTTFGSLTFNLVLLLIMLCWIIGVVDAYRIGKKMDIEENLMNHISNDNNS
ncbi:MAG: hypothetical protein BBJ57_11855 [Desulfobacterales bacterium PC51MH44]|nr:MAG: hypothetical protein BBJ57_11855 [Desulfobacterales bacterium PC51MH44]